MAIGNAHPLNTIFAKSHGKPVRLFTAAGIYQGKMLGSGLFADSIDRITLLNYRLVSDPSICGEAMTFDPAAILAIDNLEAKSGS